jgi:uncharacterized repeat protein (TIGR03803 family)
MRQKKFWFRVSGILAVLATALVLPTEAGAANTFKVLHRFTGKDGAYPSAGLIFDAAGGLYGTTYQGGPAGCGAVFKMTRGSSGTWAYSVLHVFQSKPASGPWGRLVLDKAGNLYGNAVDCGNIRNCYGVVYEITP